MVRAKDFSVSITKCSTKRCYNVATKNGICHKCWSRQYRKENPVKAAYYNLKENAKRRGKEFDLTLAQFEAFAVKTGYMKKKGIWADSFHIDRIDEQRGYTIDNIQVITNTQNVRKYLEYKYNEYERKMEFNTKVIKQRPVVATDPF